VKLPNRDLSERNEIEGDYKEDAMATIRGPIPPEGRFGTSSKKQLADGPGCCGKIFPDLCKLNNIIKHASVDSPVHFYKPASDYFLWA
jgi:hypothetical protein